MIFQHNQSYAEQNRLWPYSGQHIMANFDDKHVVVYQAYRPEIGNYAATNQYFGGAFRYTRMSWIKPNFLWMMYRSGWAEKEGQEVILSITLKRAFFDEILSLAVPSSFGASTYASHTEWKSAVNQSDVRLQWDPDHSPNGAPLERRAIQLGLRGEILERYGKEEPVDITDITSFVVEQRDNRSRLDQLEMPIERPYQPKLKAARSAVMLDSTSQD